MPTNPLGKVQTSAAAAPPPPGKNQKKSWLPSSAELQTLKQTVVDPFLGFLDIPFKSTRERAQKAIHKTFNEPVYNKQGSQVMPPLSTEHPAVAGIGNAIGEAATSMISPAGIGIVIAYTAFPEALVMRLASLGFSAAAIADLADKAPAARKAFRKGDTQTGYSLATHAVLDAFVAVGGTAHGMPAVGKGVDAMGKIVPGGGEEGFIRTRYIGKDPVTGKPTNVGESTFSNYERKGTPRQDIGKGNKVEGGVVTLSQPAQHINTEIEGALRDAQRQGLDATKLYYRDATSGGYEEPLNWQKFIERYPVAKDLLKKQIAESAPAKASAPAPGAERPLIAFSTTPPYERITLVKGSPAYMKAIAGGRAIEVPLGTPKSTIKSILEGKVAQALPPPEEAAPMTAPVPEVQAAPAPAAPETQQTSSATNTIVAPEPTVQPAAALAKPSTAPVPANLPAKITTYAEEQAVKAAYSNLLKRMASATGKARKALEANATGLEQKLADFKQLYNPTPGDRPGLVQAAQLLQANEGSRITIPAQGKKPAGDVIGYNLENDMFIVQYGANDPIYEKLPSGIATRIAQNTTRLGAQPQKKDPGLIKYKQSEVTFPGGGGKGVVKGASRTTPKAQVDLVLADLDRKVAAGDHDAKLNAAEIRTHLNKDGSLTEVNVRTTGNTESAYTAPTGRPSGMRRIEDPLDTARPLPEEGKELKRARGWSSDTADQIIDRIDRERAGLEPDEALPARSQGVASKAIAGEARDAITAEDLIARMEENPSEVAAEYGYDVSRTDEFIRALEQGERPRYFTASYYPMKRDASYGIEGAKGDISPELLPVASSKPPTAGQPGYKDPNTGKKLYTQTFLNQTDAIAGLAEHPIGSTHTAPAPIPDISNENAISGEALNKAIGRKPPAIPYSEAQLLSMIRANEAEAKVYRKQAAEILMREHRATQSESISPAERERRQTSLPSDYEALITKAGRLEAEKAELEARLPNAPKGKQNAKLPSVQLEAPVPAQPEPSIASPKLTRTRLIESYKKSLALLEPLEKKHGFRLEEASKLRAKIKKLSEEAGIAIPIPPPTSK